MDSPNISREDLYHYLPNNILAELLNTQSPLSPLKAAPLTANYSSPSFKNSPQIPPLESRLHGYLLSNASQPKERCQLNLSDIFSNLELQSEIEREIRQINGDDLFSTGCNGGDAEKDIQKFLKFDQPKLGAFKEASNN